MRRKTPQGGWHTKPSNPSAVRNCSVVPGCAALQQQLRRKHCDRAYMGALSECPPTKLICNSLHSRDQHRPYVAYCLIECSSPCSCAFELHDHNCRSGRRTCTAPVGVPRRFLFPTAKPLPPPTPVRLARSKEAHRASNSRKPRGLHFLPPPSSRVFLQGRSLHLTPPGAAGTGEPADLLADCRPTRQIETEPRKIRAR